MDSAGGAQCRAPLSGGGQTLGLSDEPPTGLDDMEDRSIFGGSQLGLSFLFGDEQAAMAREDGLARHAELGDRRGVCPALSGPGDNLARHAELGDGPASQDGGAFGQSMQVAVATVLLLVVFWYKCLRRQRPQQITITTKGPRDRALCARGAAVGTYGVSK